ncbi:hypothetical protein GM418_10935 [Maribellus comscasis]|uniref:DNA-binding protein n=1 Tax=Maribellus comscasis TaxID=2681766 RepID=A0A6I6JMM8_9BACT|nr:hypothetical protein [Maribellus comscasis]QGY44155.1 hypothetical protein GM418_10935 [Maribellus comscasis]
MSFEELVKTAPVGTSLQITVTPEVLRNFGEDIAEKTAKKLIQDLDIGKQPISEKEACKLYKKSRQSMSSYRKLGKVRYHRMGREIYYFPSELAEDMQNF